jgi:hypothetical protein
MRSTLKDLVHKARAIMTLSIMMSNLPYTVRGEYLEADALIAPTVLFVALNLQRATGRSAPARIISVDDGVLEYPWALGTDPLLGSRTVDSVADCRVLLDD